MSAYFAELASSQKELSASRVRTLGGGVRVPCTDGTTRLLPKNCVAKPLIAGADDGARSGGLAGGGATATGGGAAFGGGTGGETDKGEVAPAGGEAGDAVAGMAVGASCGFGRVSGFRARAMS